MRGEIVVRPFPIVWQRLVNEAGQTCERCGDTEAALHGAVGRLRIALAPLGLEPRLETRTLDEGTFREAPSESNRIWIAGRPLEQWLGASAGSSRCCSACGDADCRTVSVGGTVFEAVPEELIVRAALAAAESTVE